MWGLRLLAGIVALAVPAAAATELVTLTIEVPAVEVPRGGRLPVDVLATIAPGWHINAHRPIQPYLIATELSFTLPPGASVESVQYPPPEKKAFAFSGGEELLVYEGKLGLATVLAVPKGFSGERLGLEAVLRYQACNDSTCLKPTTARTELALKIVAEGMGDESALVGELEENGAGAGAPGSVFEQWLRERGMFFTLAAVVLLGLGLNLTPCVYPLISVTIAFFGSQSRSRRAVARLAVAYVLGIAVSFSVLGVVAAVSGGLFGAALQRPPVLLFIATVLVALSLSSFGLYQIQAPAGLMRWAGGTAPGMLGASFMGLTMGIVAAPCVGPVVLGLLVLVGSRQDPLLGFLLFFALALGMGAPYVALAMAAGSIKRLPRSGEWLRWTEHLFGCVLLSMAAYFISLMAPEPIHSYLVPAVVALSGAYLGFVERAGRQLRYFPALKRGVGIAFLAVAFWLALAPAPEQTIAWAPIASVDGEPAHERPMLVDFAAEWCIPCREMDRTTYVHPEVLREAERFHMVKADITEENESTTALVERYQVRGVPTVILFSSAGEERRRFVGYVGPQEMLEAMRLVE
jgi:thiol:disulfide interchange protein DsbD